MCLTWTATRGTPFVVQCIDLQINNFTQQGATTNQLGYPTWFNSNSTGTKQGSGPTQSLYLSHKRRGVSISLQFHQQPNQSKTGKKKRNQKQTANTKRYVSLKARQKKVQQKSSKHPTSKKRTKQNKKAQPKDWKTQGYYKIQ